MTEKADLYMEELLQQENIRSSAQGTQLVKKTSATNAQLNPQLQYPTQTQQTYSYQPTNPNTTNGNFILTNPQQNTQTNLNTTTAGINQRFVTTMPGNQIGSGAGVVGTQQQFSNTTPVKGGQYVVVGPPIPANQMPAQFTIYDPATGGQPTSNKNIISGGSFATQPQLNTTTTNPNPNTIQTTTITTTTNQQQQLPTPTIINQTNSNTNIPITTTQIQSPIKQAPVVASGSAVGANQFLAVPVAGNQPMIGTTPLPRTVTQITQSRLSGQAPVYNGVINQSQATATPVVTAQSVAGNPQQVGSFSSTSKIQYVPFQRKIVEYEQKQTVQKVPKTKKITEYRDETVFDLVPREAVKQDYYAVQYIKQYVAEYIPEKRVNMVRKAIPFKRIEYTPVTRQVYHGAPLGEEGSQMVPFCCDNTMERLNQLSHGTSLPWQTKNSGVVGTSLYQAHNFYGGYPGGYLSAGCCDQFKRKFNNLYDTYEPYIPSFKY